MKINNLRMDILNEKGDTDQYILYDSLEQVKHGLNRIFDEWHFDEINLKCTITGMVGMEKRKVIIKNYL